MKKENTIIIISSLAIIGVMAFLLLRKRKIQEPEQNQEYTPEQLDAVKKVSSAISSGTFKLR